VFIAIAALGLAAGCAQMSEEYKQQMFLGESFYNGFKFYEAIGNYTKAVEAAQNDDERYKALLGVANSSTEHGLAIYQHAETLIRNRNKIAGNAKVAEADKWHDNANRTFAKLLEMRPRDTIANYYLALFLYKRATTFSELPYPGTELGKSQRRKERDEAVRQFQIVLAEERGDITDPKHVAECRSPQVHRYLALALFTRSDWDRNDHQEARRNLMVYLNLLKKSHTAVTESPLSTDDPERAKLDKEQRLERLRREISDTRSLLHFQHKGLGGLIEKWQAKTENPPISDDKREMWINAAKREVAALNVLSREFEEAAEATRKKPETATNGNH
jgi:tetratricopeptide (TPR) repeat protein